MKLSDSKISSIRCWVKVEEAHEDSNLPSYSSVPQGWAVVYPWPSEIAGSRFQAWALSRFYEEGQAKLVEWLKEAAGRSTE